MADELNAQALDVKARIVNLAGNQARIALLAMQQGKNLIEALEVAEFYEAIG
jgi:hypothetical protein